MNSLSASRFHYEFTICFANSPWIHYLFRRITMNFLSFSLFHCKNTIFFRDFTIDFTNFLWIHNLLREFTLNSHLLWDFTINSSSFSLITLNSLSFSRTHYLFRGFTLNPLFFAKPLWIRYEITMRSLWIHYRLRDSSFFR